MKGSAKAKIRSFFTCGKMAAATCKRATSSTSTNHSSHQSVVFCRLAGKQLTWGEESHVFDFSLEKVRNPMSTRAVTLIYRIKNPSKDPVWQNGIRNEARVILTAPLLHRLLSSRLTGSIGIPCSVGIVRRGLVGLFNCSFVPCVLI